MLELKLIRVGKKDPRCFPMLKVKPRSFQNVCAYDCATVFLSEIILIIMFFSHKPHNPHISHNDTTEMCTHVHISYKVVHFGICTVWFARNHGTDRDLMFKHIHICFHDFSTKKKQFRLTRTYPILVNSCPMNRAYYHCPSWICLCHASFVWNITFII